MNLLQEFTSKSNIITVDLTCELPYFRNHRNRCVVLISDMVHQNHITTCFHSFKVGVTVKGLKQAALLY